MPNHVRNTVTIRGKFNVLEKIHAKLMGESPFDFDRVIPSPAVLREVHTGGATINGKHVDQWWESDGERGEIPDEILRAWKKKYGATNWYDWNLQNWGTKWNAYDVTVHRKHGELVYIFNTAWSSPFPVLKELSTQFPEATIEVFCDGEVDEPFYYGFGPQIDREKPIL